MPIYEFQCGACGERVEELMRLSDPDPVECPKCGAPQLKRMLSAPSFRLSGAGWYETDFKGDKDKKRNIAGDSAGDSKSETKSDAKPDTAAAAPAKTEASAPAPAATPSTPAPAPKSGS
jgi:putative FmdB family regulatory protein